MNKAISTNRPVFLVKFLNSSENFIFGSSSEVLGDLIENNGNNGIEFIKQFDSNSNSFKKMSKKEVKNWFDWETYTIEQLKKVNFIK